MTYSAGFRGRYRKNERTSHLLFEIKKRGPVIHILVVSQMAWSACSNLSGSVHLRGVDQSEYISKLEAQNKLLLEQVTLLTYELRDMKRMLFGRKSERFLPQPPTAQLNLAELMAEAVTPPVIAQEVKVIKKQTTEVKPTGRHALPAHLPKVDIILEPMEDTSGLEKIGEEITEQLDYTPGKLLVRRYIRPKYAKVVADGTGYTEVIIAPLPDFPIEKGIPAPGLLAQILVDKHVDHLPIYRQIKRYQRDGVKLSASTISGWLDATADLLQPLGRELIKVVLSGDYVQADETPLPVLNGETKGAVHTGYLWAYHSPPNQLIFYDFQPGRGKEGPIHLLKDYSGYLQTDGYGVYEHAAIGGRKEITLIHCMAHARRYFEKALDNDKQRAEHVLTEMQLLYGIERRSKEGNMSTGQLLEHRRQEALPVLERLKTWLQENYSQVLPKSPIGKAIAYSLPRWIDYPCMQRMADCRSITTQSKMPFALWPWDVKISCSPVPMTVGNAWRYFIPYWLAAKNKRSILGNTLKTSSNECPELELVS
jgi:transposase